MFSVAKWALQQEGVHRLVLSVDDTDALITSIAMHDTIRANDSQEIGVLRGNSGRRKLVDIGAAVKRVRAMLPPRLRGISMRWLQGFYSFGGQDCVSGVRGHSTPTMLTTLFSLCQKHPALGRRVLEALAALGTAGFEFERKQLMKLTVTKVVEFPIDFLKSKMPHFFALQNFMSVLFKQPAGYTVNQARARQMNTKMFNLNTLICPENPFAEHVKRADIACEFVYLATTNPKDPAPSVENRGWQTPTGGGHPGSCNHDVRNNAPRICSEAYLRL